MSPAALARRINTIEKACGKYAVVKMRLFARVLCLEGHEDLSSDATAAFQRLVAKVPFPFRSRRACVSLCSLTSRRLLTQRGSSSVSQSRKEKRGRTSERCGLP